ncbi:MAG TPA: hypothetical protein PLV07_00640 [Acidiphilium sp.]|uniref:hypothetical protein n=1 Tax=unclassified Acidiphilium TaxID=2617493 RepID=UPI0025BB7229|nr:MULTISPECIES: hypothetical protein [unclassified Acidiphilium]HQT60416.1 hypothetical protein [Acidiphilium sp.]HQU10062.1 hypothetical protein [Acidiphilium sp.]
MEEKPPQPWRLPARLIKQYVHGSEQFVRMRDAAGGELTEMLGFQRVKNPDVAHWQGNRRFWRCVEQADPLPSLCRILRADRPAHPPGGAGDQQRMQAWRIARPLVEQVLQAAANLDCEQIDEPVGVAAAKPQPETVRKGSHPRCAGNFQGRGLAFLHRPGPRPQPNAALVRICRFEPRRGLWPCPDPVAQVTVHALKLRHFSSKSSC